jgi:predicted nucleotidyltransferase
VAAAKSVLIELVHLLGQYRDEIVLVGGWGPELLLGDHVPPHTGSMDIDLALDHKRLQEEGYRTIQELLLGREYRQGAQPFKFIRRIVLSGATFNVEVDLMAGEYEGTSRGRRHQRVQGIHARKARGCDLAFESPTEIRVDGQLPGGGRDSVVVRVASIMPFLVMKGMALAERLKEKDAWDIDYCVRNYPGGIDALVEEFRPQLTHGLVQEGLKKIADAFASVDQWGPASVADFDEITDPDDRALRRRDAFERVNLLLERLRTR